MLLLSCSRLARAFDRGPLFDDLSFELFHGDTAFRPRDWAIKISPTFSIPNYVNARENGIINIDVRRGTNRTDTHVSLEEAFAEMKLRDLSPNFDFISVRAGIQPFAVWIYSVGGSQAQLSVAVSVLSLLVTWALLLALAGVGGRTRTASSRG